MMACPVTENSYRSPPMQPGRLARLCPSLSFYLPMVKLIWWGSREAKEGRLNAEKRVWGTTELMRLLESVGVRFEIENTNAFRQLSTPCVFISNHMSTLETFIFTPIIEPYREITYVIKESLVKYPVFKHIMINQEPIVVTRTSAKADLRTVLQEGPERLARGKSVVVFPQTTRSNEFDPAHFSTIGTKLAARTGVPVVPVALKTDAWGNRRHLVKEFGPIDPAKTVHIRFGEPLPVERSGRKVHEQVIKHIQDSLAQWT